MKKLSKIAKVTLALSIAVLLIASCANPLQPSLTSSSYAESKSTSDVGTDSSYTLWSGQTINAGTVSISRDATKLYVVYETDSNYLISETHVWVGTDISAVPSNTNGVLVPGQFDKGKSGIGKIASYSPNVSKAVVEITISESWTADTQLYVFAHSALIGQNGAGNETGFGGGVGVNVGDKTKPPRWYYYIPYRLPEAPTTDSGTENPTYSISGVVFHDVNNNGILDSGELGLSGVKVAISSGLSTISDADGLYSFTGLVAGTYTVSSNGPSGYFATPYSAPVNYKSMAVQESKSAVNFGFSYETIQNLAFYDANRDGVYQEGEPLLSGIAIQLSTGAMATIGSDGSYTFTNLKGDESYTVSIGDLVGFLHNGSASQNVTLGAVYGKPKMANFGFMLDYSWVSGQTANGNTIGFWKTNLDKAIANKTNGTQVSKETLLNYVAQLSNLALSPLNVTTLQQASDILSKSSSLPSDLLSKQLMGSEFNHANGAYIGGNRLVTYFFLYDGEYMLANPGLFSSAQLLAQKDKYDAYNNSHGGVFYF